MRIAAWNVNALSARLEKVVWWLARARPDVLLEIDREARKGKPTPSDHAPLVVDVDEPGQPFDAGWTSAEQRIAKRRAGAKA